MLLVATMWDDGLVTDLKLLDILRKKNATACFAISPSRHKNNRTSNDSRGDYGLLVAKNELKEFADFEICNHTDNHIDLKKATPKTIENEIIYGRKKLEDIFERKINGFCYPYGEYNKTAIDILKQQKTAYARTTLSSQNQPKNRLLLSPSHRWNELQLDSIFENSLLIIWGHTYEFKNQFDWDRIEKMYELFTQHPNIQLISFEMLVRQLWAF
jgi:peptidoglycan/xylan/chitin deacetylase (PgdA/CDA1 family)